MLNVQLILWFLHDNHTAYREPELGDFIVRMESLAADCSDSNNNNNNNSEERITTTTTTTDLCAVPLLFREFSTLEHNHPAPCDADDLPDAESFIAEPTILKTLTGEHGFSGVAARKALYWTRNESMESGNNRRELARL